MLSVITFSGAYKLPFRAARRQGFLAQNGVELELTFTPDSVFLMTGLIDRRFDAAIATIDHLLAYRGRSVNPQSGLIHNGEPDLTGIEVVLQPRSRFGEPRKALRDPARCINRSYLDRP